MLVSSNGGSGLPATIGSTSTAARIACTSVPFPGAFPAAVGIVRSRLVAYHFAPSLIACAPSASITQFTSG